ncbi:MAG: hypothetical protein PHW64_00005 [Sulfuricurvum sp.]|nr:hypothetical protein [Sulfuricurvum sp.]
MKRAAFTMLEFIFVIVVIGVLAVLSMPSFTSNQLQQAAEQVAGHIRYTQHLAIVDDRFDANQQLWYREMWMFYIRSVHDVNNNGQKEWFYEVFSDKSDDGDSTIDEEATDPMTGETLGNGSFNNTVDDNKIINLTRKYGIKNVTVSGGANAVNSTQKRVVFDSFGRPYRNTSLNDPATEDWRNYRLTSDMNITLTGENDKTAVITIRPETGFVSIQYP